MNLEENFGLSTFLSMKSINHSCNIVVKGEKIQTITLQAFVYYSCFLFVN